MNGRWFHSSQASSPWQLSSRQEARSPGRCRPHPRTAHYTITLDIGPRVDDADARPSRQGHRGESWSRCPHAQPTMTMTDQGRPVNRHLEVVVYDKATGAPLGSPRPTITVTTRQPGSADAAGLWACMTSKR